VGSNGQQAFPLWNAGENQREFPPQQPGSNLSQMPFPPTGNGQQAFPPWNAGQEQQEFSPQDNWTPQQTLQWPAANDWSAGNRSRAER
jgi:hypothetical protein